MKKLLTILAATLGFVALGPATASTSMSPVLSFADFSDAGGESRITRTDTMILALLEAANLVPGNAYTL